MIARAITEMVRLKPDATYAYVRLKPDTTYAYMASAFRRTGRICVRGVRL